MRSARTTPYHQSLSRSSRTTLSAPSSESSSRRPKPEIVSPLLPDPEPGRELVAVVEKPPARTTTSRLPSVPRQRASAPPKPQLPPSDPRKYAQLRALRPKILEVMRVARADGQMPM